MPRSIPAPRATLRGPGRRLRPRARRAPRPRSRPSRAASDTYFGTTVTDSYRYMEDLSAPEVQQWAHAQADFARAALDAIPGRAQLLARIRELEASVARARDAGQAAAPATSSSYEKRGADDNQFKLVVRKGLQGRGSPAGRSRRRSPRRAARRRRSSSSQPSHNGRFVAYGLSAGGSEQAVIHVDRRRDRQGGDRADRPRALQRRRRGRPTTAASSTCASARSPRARPRARSSSARPRSSIAWPGTGADQAVLVAGTDEHLKIAAEEFPFVAADRGHALGGRRSPATASPNEFDLYAAPQAKALDPKLKWRKLFGREPRSPPSRSTATTSTC